MTRPHGHRRGQHLIPRNFEYHSPKTIGEAVSLAARFNGDSKFLAGGQSLIPLMKLRIVSPGHIIDLNNLVGLDYIRKDHGILAIGALCRMSDIEASRILKDNSPLLVDCASKIADPLVRNLGTMGGNICHADPTNDMPAVMVAADAEMVILGPGGERRFRAPDFFKDMFTTALEEGEVLREVRIDPSFTRGSSYLKLERQAGDFGIIGVAVCLAVSRNGRVEYCGVGLTGVGPTVVRAARAEDSLRGRALTLELVEEAASLASEDSRPTTDLRGSAEYKREMVKVLSAKAINLARRRAGRNSK